MNSSIEPMRMGSGSMTTVAPVSQLAWIAVTRSRVVGPISPTEWPGSTPRAWSSAAMARASSWTRAHSTASVVYAALSVAPVANVIERCRSAAASRRGRREREERGSVIVGFDSGGMRGGYALTAPTLGVQQ